LDVVGADVDGETGNLVKIIFGLEVRDEGSKIVESTNATDGFRFGSISTIFTRVVPGT
jgi:hypothetical protein